MDNQNWNATLTAMLNTEDEDERYRIALKRATAITEAETEYQTAQAEWEAAATASAEAWAVWYENDTDEALVDAITAQQKNDRALLQIEVLKSKTHDIARMLVDHIHDYSLEADWEPQPTQ